MSNVNEWRDLIIKAAQTQLSLGNPDERADPNLLNIYLNFGIAEIKRRRKLKNDDELLSGIHDYVLVRFIVRSYNEGGVEGAESATSLGTTRNFTLSPLAELKSNVRQII